MRPRKAYDDMKNHAKDREIEFLLSYEDFLEMWLLSGRWSERGKMSGQYQMCRFYDEGPYSKNNCYIGTTTENQKDKNKIPEGQTGNILKDWLSGITQKEIGNKYNLDQSTISRIVNGKRRKNIN